VPTRALHWSLFWARSIQSTPSHPISPRSILQEAKTYVVHTHTHTLAETPILPQCFSCSKL
jgi:hypothetical protein